MRNVMLFADTRTGSSALFWLIRQTYHAHRQIDNYPARLPDAMGSQRNSTTRSKQDDKLIEGIGEPWHAGVVNYYFENETYRELYSGIKHDNVVLKDQPWHILRDIHDNVYRISYGCKHIWSHLTEGTNYSLLLKSINEDHKIIFLDRNAIGRKSLSHLLAQQTNHWGKYTNGVPKFESVDLDRLKFLCDRYKRTKRDYKTFLEEYTDNVYFATYENIFCRDTYEEKLSALQDVIEFLGFDRDDVVYTSAETRLNPDQRQNTDDILRTIPNIKDVCRLIRDEYGEHILPRPW